MADSLPHLLHLPTTDGDQPSHVAVQLKEPLTEPGDAGANATVLYLHGFGSSQGGTKAAFFRERFVEAGMAFCSLDFQGHGESGGSMFGLSLSRNLDDVDRVHRWLEEQGHGPVLLVGSSMGGLTALWHAARHPERVAAALHLAPALDLGRNFVDRVGEEGLRLWRQEGKIHVKNELVDCRLGWNFVEDFERFPLEDLQAQYRTPTLLLQGKHDDSVNWRSVAAFATECAYDGLELHLFADGDHRLIEQRERLWALMGEFLDGRQIHR